MTGQLFGDRYQVGDTLGFGGMSEVHRGRDLRLGRDVAIKVLRADLARDPSFQTRFRREAQNAASLNHPAIVAVYDTGETEGPSGMGPTGTTVGGASDRVPYIVMEYVDGETLRDVLKREGPMAPKRAMEIVADVCAALDFSHRHGIVHRDVKPANIMLTRAGAVKVMDFGIARAVADGQSSVTATAAVIGTAQYLSPEQARGEAVDARSDVYSTGCVLYELLTGSPPFVGDSPVAVAYQHVREDPKPPSASRPGLPREMDAIVLKALNKNPLNRYQTAAEMRADLVRALSGQAVQAPRVMDDAERTEMLGGVRGAPTRVGVGATPPILAAPRKYEEQWDDEDDESSRTKKIWGYVGIGAICLALLAGAILLTIRFTSGPAPVPDVAVPNLYSMTQEQAAQALTQRQLKLAVDPTPVESDDNLKGRVVSQNPSDGTPRQPGTTVTVKLGKGIDTIQVPNLKGLSSADAQKTLVGLKLTPKVNPVASDASQKDLVVDQDPAVNATVEPGATVTINVGAGPNLVKIPDGLVGMSYSDAAAALKKVNLQAKQNYVDNEAPLDQVLAIQQYQPGQQVTENSIITLDTSNFTIFVVPDVAANRPTPQQAQQQLVQAGYQGQIPTKEQPTSEQAAWGQVIGQDPAPNTKLKKVGTSITLIVGAEPTFALPNLVGLSPAQASTALAQQGYVGNLTVNVAGTAPQGQGNRVYQVRTTDGNDVVPQTNLKVSTPLVLTVYPPEPAPPASSSGAPSSAPSSQPSGPGNGNGNGNGNGGPGNNPPSQPGG